MISVGGSIDFNEVEINLKMMNPINLLGIIFLCVSASLFQPIGSYGHDLDVPESSQEISVSVKSLGNSLLNTPPPNPQCDANVPYYLVDLTGDPDSTWLSPNVGRQGNCCSTSHPDRCISFTVILDKNAVGLEFDIAEGAIPGGSLFYQIDCGTQHVVGDGICLEGGKSYEVTFCKPGANKNVYRIRSIPGIIIPDTVSTRINCPVNIEINGVDPTTVSWNDITGGGTYNSYLSCTSGCLTNTFIADNSAPSTILYEVCGDAIDATCGATFNVCDTVVVNVFPEVEVSIISDLTFCSGTPSTLTASATPVSSTYSYEWYDNSNASGNIVSTSDTFIPSTGGAYSVVAVDYVSPLGCSYDTLNFDITVLDCIPVCPTVTVCPGGSVTFSTVSDFVAAGGIINFPCAVNDANIQLINSVSDGDTCPEIITQTYEIWDDCGNRASCDVQIIRTDAEAPALTGIPGDITVVCSTPPAPPVIYTDITATDNCDTNVEITMTETSTQTFDNSYTSVVYQIVRTWTAADDCGNTTSQTQTINAVCEYCYNGVDDDGDGAIDESDPDCPCSFPNYKLTCENIQYYYVPPVWQMNPSYGGGSTYTDPSSLVISTPFGTANVSIQSSDGSFSQSLTVNQGTAEVVPLTNTIVQTPNYNSVENDKGLIIESDQLIQVIYRISADNNKMLVTIKGEQALGQRFRAGSQTNVCGAPNTSKRENHFISVMAVEDNTTIDFEFTADMKDLGNTHSVTLNAGETYLMIDDDNNQNVSGSLITSDRPIAVISGSQHSRQCNGQSGRDAGADQLIPTCGIGTDYVVTRGLDDDATSEANYAVVVAVTSNTEVYVNGNSAPVATLNPGEFYTYDMPGPDFSRHYIQTSNPAYLYQFGSVQTNGEIGMAIAAPIDGCRGDRFVEFYRFPNSTVNNVTTLVPNTGLSTLTLNGNPYTNYATAEAIPGLSSWSAVTFDDAALNNYNIIESDELFNASQFVGNPNGGTFGYLTSFKDKIFVYDPNTGLPTYNYFADTICADSPYSHCINSSSCSGNQFITSIIGSSHTGSYDITPNSTCFEYTPDIGYNGMDTITVLLSDDFGFTQAVCISFYICGTLPLIDGITDSTATCTIGEIPPYANFSEFLADGGSASDDCSGLDIASFNLLSETSDGNSCPETVTRVYEIANECGLASTFTQTIVIDNTNLPTLAGVPKDTTVNCDAVPSPPVIGTDIIGASFCAIPPTVVMDETRVDGTCPFVYQLTRTWTVIDECGNSYSESQLINVIDTIPPVATDPAPITIQCSADIPAPDPSIVTDENDNCSSNITVAFVNDISDGNSCPETITRTYSLTDECGNSSTVNQIITINDDIQPLISCIPDLTVANITLLPPAVNTFVDFMIEGGSASDNCELDTASFILLGEIAGNVSGNDIVTRTYQIADLCGNIASCDQVITIGTPTTSTDDPDNIWVECIDEVPAPIASFQELINAGGNASSTCGLDTTSLVMATETSNGNTCPEIITRTFEITDSCGNVIPLSHQITVHDVTDPTINCLPDITALTIALVPPAATSFDEFILQGGNATDNCELDTASFALTNEVINTVGANQVISRRYQIADLCGNTTVCDQEITITDTGITATPINDVVECIDEVPGTFSTFRELINNGGSVTSSCGIDTTTFRLVSEISDGNSCPEVINRIYEVTDSCGNTASIPHQIVVDDVTPPIINCIPDTTVLSAPPVPLAAVDFNDFITQGGSASDNCELDTTSFILLNEVTDTVSGNEILTRTYQIADMCGNVSSCDQKITIGNPTTVFDDPDDVLVECIDEVSSPISTYHELINNGGSAISTCGIDTTSFALVSEISDGNTCPEIITRTYQISDSCGNVINLSQQITVDDITPPTITCLPDTTVTGIQLVPPAIPNLDDFIAKGGTASDNCELDSTSFILFDETVDITGGNKIFTRTYQIADQCGNTAICEQEITLVPITSTVDPLEETFDCIDELPVAYNSFYQLLNDGGDITSTCGIDTTTFTLTTDMSDGSNCPEVITRTYEVADSCGNVMTVTHKIYIDDDVPPVINCLPDTIIYNIPTIPPSVTTFDEFILNGGSASDNCELDSTSFLLINEVNNKVGGENITTRTYQIADICGNTSNCEQEITHIPDLNNPPEANDDYFREGCFTITGNLIENDTDPDGHNLIMNTSPVILPNHGVLTLYADGSFTYEFEPNTTAIDSFIYEVCDDTYDSKCDMATVYITLFNDNDCDGVDDAIDIDDDDDGILDVTEGDGSIDSDGDGIPDSLDIDADNDGIVDNIEVQPEGHYVAPIGIDENENGLDDAYEDATKLGIPPVDTDKDGTPDYLDLDTDDDGIPDLIEGFDIGAKGIANKKPTEMDQDNDGYDDVFDGYDGPYNIDNLDNPFGSTAELEDFDNDGWRDWRDVDDDNDGILTKWEDLNNDGNYSNDDVDMDGHPEYLDKREECELFIPEGFSPNGDGVHDFFQIYCIEKFPNAKLFIFDRWGNQLYEHENYGNLDFWGNYEEAWWNGTLTKNPGKKVRAETHLYILETVPGNSERGFVMVSY